jgi:hypothetical protein
MRKSAMKFLGVFLGLAWHAVISAAAGQPVIEERTIRDLGSVQIDGTSIKFLIAYGGDSAILEFSVAGSGGRERYVPLFGSTDRGVSAVTLNAVVSKSNDQLWVQSSWPGNEILAYYRLGADTATTPWGPMGLLDTPFPKHLSGGPVPFPPFDPGGVRSLATFHHAGDR